MVDPWESVDLTMTCDSDGESSLTPDGEPVVSIQRLAAGNELRRPIVLPSLAQRFTDIYLRKSSNTLERSCSPEGISSEHPKNRNQGSSIPGDFKSNIGVETSFNIIPFSLNIDLPEAKRTKLRPTYEFDCLGNRGVQYDEVIEIDDDSDNEAAIDAPVVSTNHGNHFSTKDVGVSAITEIDHWEEVDIKNHNGEPPIPNLSSPAPLLSSPEPPKTSQVPYLNPRLVNEQKVGIPLCNKITLSTGPLSKTLVVDQQPEIETENILRIHSENGADSLLVQSPYSPMYYCVYCEYSTMVEEWCHKHIASHQPGSKPYLRMYCTECLISTDYENFLRFHMFVAHNIMDPKLYRSGEERYTCMLCKLTLESRFDVETHIYNTHGTQTQFAFLPSDEKGKRARGWRYQCVEKGCARRCKTIHMLRNHVLEQHRIIPLLYLVRKGKSAKHAAYRCFTCDFKAPNEKKVRLHAKMHYAIEEPPDDEDVTRNSVCQSEEISAKEHNQEFLPASPHVTSPGHHRKSPNPLINPSDIDSKTSLSISSYESNLETRVPHPTSPEPDYVDDELLIDMPEHDNESSPPPYESHSDEYDEEVDSYNDRIESDCNSENRRCQPRTFYCIYCEYTTVIEEWYHKHIASHLPGTKPYLRLYCTECSYSTGSEKFLLFHMSQTHRIVNPGFYRSGEKRYTCRICKHTLELRIDIEAHIKAKHSDEKQTQAKKKKDLKVVFQCREEKCGKCYKTLKALYSHTQKYHNIRFPSYYYERSQAGELKLACFSCNKFVERGKCHAKLHYSSKQRMAPYLYYCPLPHEDSKVPFSCKKRSEIIVHFESVHSKEVKYYKKCKRTYACLNCHHVASSVLIIKNHCDVYCRNR